MISSFFSADGKPLIRESCLCSQWMVLVFLTSVGTGDFTRMNAGTVGYWTHEELQCSFQLNNIVFSACVLLLVCLKVLFSCVLVLLQQMPHILCYPSKHVSYTEHLYTQNILYIWLCTHKFVLSACHFDLLLFNITCNLNWLTSNSYTAFPTILFFKMCQ